MNKFFSSKRRPDRRNSNPEAIPTPSFNDSLSQFKVRMPPRARPESFSEKQSRESLVSTCNVARSSSHKSAIRRGSKNHVNFDPSVDYIAGVGSSPGYAFERRRSSCFANLDCGVVVHDEETCRGTAENEDCIPKSKKVSFYVL